jgi:hypothetical protein
MLGGGTSTSWNSEIAASHGTTGDFCRHRGEPSERSVALQARWMAARPLARQARQKVAKAAAFTRSSPVRSVLGRVAVLRTRAMNLDPHVIHLLQILAGLGSCIVVAGLLLGVINFIAMMFDRRDDPT